MNRIDFHSIATILLGGLIDADYSQMDFIYMLFGSFANDNVDFAFDNGLVCKWIKGQSQNYQLLQHRKEQGQVL